MLTNIQETLQRVKLAAKTIAAQNKGIRDKVLLELAKLICQNSNQILAANSADLARMDPQNPQYDRLLLSEARIEVMSADVTKVAGFKSPVGQIIQERVLANGMKLKKISVPLGVVAVIYEARPNVTIDVFCLCFKSGNATVLKGGSEAQNSNQILIDLIHQSLNKYGLTTDLAYLLPPNREAVHELLKARGLVDVCIPRGSQRLIDFVRVNASIPVIETGAGIVHAYFDQSGDLAKGSKIIYNAKTRRVSVCNALDTLIIHRERLADLPALINSLALRDVIIYADTESYSKLHGNYPPQLLRLADQDSFGTEFLDYKLSIRVVASLDEAITHIMTYTSGHSEVIIAKDADIINEFMDRVDAAVVYANASTAFTDGGEFGMGCEIGISTQKLHARGPMSLAELTSYKWLAYGEGHIR